MDTKNDVQGKNAKGFFIFRSKDGNLIHHSNAGQDANFHMHKKVMDDFNACYGGIILNSLSNSCTVDLSKCTNMFQPSEFAIADAAYQQQQTEHTEEK